jgi:hypothetical protein
MRVEKSLRIVRSPNALAHGQQPAAAAFVAGAPRRDAAEQPMLLALEGPVQAPGLLRLGCGDLLGPGVEVGVALVEPADRPVLQPEGLGGDPLQEGAVVADDQGRGAGGGELGLENFDGQDVEVVGGFVQQEDVGLFGEGPRQGGAPDLAAGEAPRRLVATQPEDFQGRLGFMRRGAARDGVVQQGLAGDLGFLRRIGDPRPRRDRALAAVRLGLACQDPQQRRLAGAVAAHQAGAAPGVQPQVDAVEQHQGPVGQADILEGEDRGLHPPAT